MGSTQGVEWSHQGARPWAKLSKNGLTGPDGVAGRGNLSTTGNTFHRGGGVKNVGTRGSTKVKKQINNWGGECKGHRKKMRKGYHQTTKIYKGLSGVNWARTNGILLVAGGKGDIRKTGWNPARKPEPNRKETLGNASKLGSRGKKLSGGQVTTN